MNQEELEILLTSGMREIYLLGGPMSSLSTG